MPNPFYHGGYVKNLAGFVGRQAELNVIFGALETVHSGQLQSISVVGPRRIGKSSLLYHVTQTYVARLARPEAYRVAYVDLQDPHCATLEGLLGHVLTKLKLKNSTPIGLAGFQESVEELSRHSRQLLFPVVCFDEFERLTKKPSEFSDDLFNAWRALIGGNRIAFVTASHVSLTKLSREGRLTSPFFNVFTLVQLGELTEIEAKSLADRGRTCDRPFSDREVEMVLRAGNRHPLKLQVAGSLVYEAKVGGRFVSWDMVRIGFHRRTNFAFGKLPWWQLLAGGIDRFLQQVGRALVLMVTHREEDGALYRTLGIAVVLLTVGIVVGLSLHFISLDDLKRLVKAWIGQREKK